MTWYDLHTIGAPPSPAVNWSHMDPTDGPNPNWRATTDDKPYN